MTTVLKAIPSHDPSMTLIRMPEVISIVGLARPTIYKLMRQPESGFPLGPQRCYVVKTVPGTDESEAKAA